MKLYVCYGTFPSRKPEGHPCRTAHLALTAAGYAPDVVRTYGCVLNPVFPGRREVKHLTGNYQVPTLVLDDGTVIDGTANIMGWAASNPAMHATAPPPA
jgi:hypothetical protein